MNEGVEVKKKPSRFWYLVPILFGIVGGVILGILGGLVGYLAAFLGILGGLIGYFAVRKEDNVFAKRLLIIGIGVAVIIALSGFLHEYLTFVQVTEYTKKHIETVAETGEEQLRCEYSLLSIDKDGISVTDNSLDVTLSYVEGSKDLTDFVFVVRTTTGAVYSSEKQKITMEPGQVVPFHVNIPGLRGEWTEIRVNAVCAGLYGVSTSILREEI